MVLKFSLPECLWSSLQKLLLPLYREILWIIKEAKDKRPLNRHAKQNQMSLPISTKLVQNPLTGLSHAHDYCMHAHTHSSTVLERHTRTWSCVNIQTPTPTQCICYCVCVYKDEHGCRRAHKHTEMAETHTRHLSLLAPSKQIIDALIESAIMLGAHGSRELIISCDRSS